MTTLAGYAYWFTGTSMDYINWAPYSDPEYNYGRAYVTLSYDGNQFCFTFKFILGTMHHK